MTVEIRLAAFDLGNVMVDVREDIPAQQLAELSGRPVSEVLQEIFSPEKKAAFESGKLSWEQHAKAAIVELGLPINEPELRQMYRLSLIPDDPVIGTVSSVSQQVQITIASNTSQPHWEWVQENLPFARDFDPPILSHLVGAMKPGAAFYEALVQRSGYEAEQIFFTDDRPENIEGASRLGIRAFLFEGHEKLIADLRSCGIKV